MNLTHDFYSKEFCCTYCGDWFENLDHLIPQSYEVFVKRSNFSKLSGAVSSCAECNRLLSDIMIHSVGERADFLISVYQKRYKKLLKSPDWDEEEMKELDHGILTLVKDKMYKKTLIRCKISNLQLCAIGHCVVPIHF